MSMIRRLSLVPRYKSILYSNKSLPFSAVNYASEASSSSSTPPPPPPKSKRTGLKLMAVTLIGFGVGLTYTTYTPEYRKEVELNVPYSKELFQFVDRSVEDLIKRIYGPTVQVPTSTQQNESPKPIEINEKLPKEAPKPQPKVEVKPPAKSQPQPQQQQQKPQPQKQTASTQVQTQKSGADSNGDTLQSVNVDVKPTADWKQTMREHELQEEAAIKAIEQKLDNGVKDVKSKVDDALTSCKKSVDSLKKYADSLRNALDDALSDDNKDQQWRLVTDLFDVQSHDAKEANEKITAAKKTIADLDKLLVDVKSSELSKFVGNLRDSQLELIKKHRELQVEKAKLSEAVIHAHVLRSYTNEQKSARNQFLKEIQSLQPEGITGKRNDDQLSNEELNSLLIHAHKRLIQLQKQIAKMQTIETKHIQSALEEQRKEFDKMQNENIQSTVEASRREFELEKDKLIEELRVKSNEELRKELSRQAAAHNNHLAQMLRIQQEELESLYDKKLLMESEKIRQKFYASVADSVGRLKGIEQALLARANLELQAQNAKQLWLAIQNINEIVNTRAQELKSAAISESNSELADIKKNVNTIRSSAPDNQFINTLLVTLNPLALERGIWTEPDLKERFSYLRKICKRVALIDDRGGSLLKYFVSYLQSFFIFNTATLNNATKDLDLDEKQLNTFTILDYAENYVEQGDFEMAIRLLQQLKGEPKRLAKDWINEAILLLEVKQVCTLLTAYISSVYIGTNLKD